MLFELCVLKMYCIKVCGNPYKKGTVLQLREKIGNQITVSKYWVFVAGLQCYLKTKKLNERQVFL